MSLRIWTRILSAAAILGGCSSALALSPPSQAFTLSARLTPDALGVPTNVATSMTLVEGESVPKPVSEVLAYGPSGLRLDVRGIATCARTELEADGPRGCPGESRVGFGGGVGAVELGGATVKEPYTLDFFLAPREHGQLRMLIYVAASRPVPVEFVLAADEVRGPRPYGFGLDVEVPPISTVPGAAFVSVESGYASLGAPDVAYYQTIHGRRKLVHIKGLIAPTECPSGGFPFEMLVTFEDRTTSTGRYRSPCPGGR